MFTEKDLKQIAGRGMTEQQVATQLEQIAEGFPFLRLEAAASAGKGVVVVSEEEKKQKIKEWENYKSEGHTIVKFVPA